MFRPSINVSLAAVWLVALTACETPAAVREQAIVAATNVGAFREQLQTNTQAANEAVQGRKQRLIEAFKQGTKLEKAIVLASVIEIETDPRKKAAHDRMTKVADRLTVFDADAATRSRDFAKAVNAAATAIPGSFPELQKTQSSLLTLSKELDEEATLKFLLQYAKATAAVMKEQSAALKKEKDEKPKDQTKPAS